LNKIREDFTSGQMLSGEIKNILAETLIPIIENHQQARLNVTDDIIKHYMTPRPLI